MPALSLDRYRWAIRLPYHAVDRNNQPVIDPRGYGLALEALGALGKLTESFPLLADHDKAEVMDWQLRLHLQMGLARDVADVLKARAHAGSKDHELQALAAAAMGDYAQFDRSLLALEQSQEPIWAAGAAWSVASYVAGLAVTSRQPLCCNHGMVVQSLGEPGRHAAELRGLRGMLALEQGDTARARSLFNDALQLAGPHTFFPGRPIVERYLRCYGQLSGN